jgi:hypothetical protein
MQPLLVLYGAIAKAGGGSLDVVYEAEQMFVAADGDTVRALVAESMDVTVGSNLEVAGRVGVSDGAIATAGGGSLDVVYEAEHMFVAVDGETVRALVAESLDVTVGANLEVAGRVSESDGSISVRLVGGAGRPIATKMEQLAAVHDIRLNSDEDETLLMIPALARAGVDSNT